MLNIFPELNNNDLCRGECHAKEGKFQDDCPYIMEEYPNCKLIKNKIIKRKR